MFKSFRIFLNTQIENMKIIHNLFVLHQTPPDVTPCSGLSPAATLTVTQTCKLVYGQ